VTEAMPPWAYWVLDSFESHVQGVVQARDAAADDQEVCLLNRVHDLFGSYLKPCYK